MAYHMDEQRAAQDRKACFKNLDLNENFVLDHVECVNLLNLLNAKITTVVREQLGRRYHDVTQLLRMELEACRTLSKHKCVAQIYSEQNVMEKQITDLSLNQGPG